jgi:hypothetical protein
MQHTRAANWQERELAQLQDEVAVLRRLVRAITPPGHESTDTQRHDVEPSAPQSTPSKKRKIRHEH